MAVLGRGRVGRSLTDALRCAGVACTNVSARDRLAVSAELARAGIVFLAVPDDAVRPTANALAQCDVETFTGFAHLSGALGLEELAALREQGHAVGSFHPFQPFSAQRPPSAFNNSTVGIEASDDHMARQLTHIATLIGATARPVSAKDRALYHAAAVMASTYIVVLAAQAKMVLEAVGWKADEALEALLPLMRGTLENLAMDRIPRALSGPLRRGDVATIARHLKALDEASLDLNCGETYRVLGGAAVRLALNTGLERTAAERITELLSQRP